MTDPINPDAITRLLELIAAATSGGRGWRAVMRGDEWRIRAPHPAASSCEPSLDCENNVKAIVEVFNAIHPILDQLTAQAAEIERLRAELAVEQQHRNGHLPDCAGIDLEQMRCGCGYLDGTAYRSLADEIARLKAECIREHDREFAPFCEQSERADKADARVVGDGTARWEWVEATGG